MIKRPELDNEEFDPAAAKQEERLRALLDPFHVTHRETLEALDASEEKLDKLMAKLDAAMPR